MCEHRVQFLVTLVTTRVGLCWNSVVMFCTFYALAQAIFLSKLGGMLRTCANTTYKRWVGDHHGKALLELCGRVLHPVYMWTSIYMLI